MFLILVYNIHLYTINIYNIHMYLCTLNFHFDLNVRTEIWMITILLFVCRRTWNFYLLFHYQWFLLLFPIQISQCYFLNTCILYFRRRMFLNNFFHIYVLLQLMEKGHFQAPNESTNDCVRTNNTNVLNEKSKNKTQNRTRNEHDLKYYIYSVSQHKSSIAWQ